MPPANFSLRTRCLSEFIATAFLVAAVVGSGIMGERLASGNLAIALLANTIATGAALFALISTVGPISGAQLNPAVTLTLALRKLFPWSDLPFYLLAQFSGAILGTILAHLMFGLSWYSFSVHARSGPPQLLSEFIATFGLLCVILGCSRFRPAAIPLAVAAYITSAYWFTASTSFANPAVTIARAFSNTFSGIRPTDAPAFIAAQLAGALAAAALFSVLPAVQPAPPPPLS